MRRAADQFSKGCCCSSSRRSDCLHSHHPHRPCPLPASDSTTMGIARISDIRASDSIKPGASNAWDVPRMLEQEQPVIKMEPVPEAQMAKTFASAIDDIIKGRRPSRRSRGKPRLDKGKARSERAKVRTDRACVCCEKCGASFASIGNLNRHRRVSHQGLRVYCDFPDCHQVRFLEQMKLGCKSIRFTSYLAFVCTLHTTWN